MSPLALVAIVPAAVILLAAIEAPACAWFIGRLKRRARSYTDLVISRPEVPQPEPVPPLVFPADVTLAELEQAALAHDFTEIIRREFPQYRSFRDAA